MNLGAPACLLRNVTATSNHWIAFKLVGHKSNRDGIGAQIEVFAGALHLQRERVGSSGYLSGDDPRVHFGLGAATKVDKVVVTWPTGGAKQVIENVAADRIVTIEEK